jgi:uncharacterized protein with von Willebrand factor type A (vWA) domain
MKSEPLLLDFFELLRSRGVPVTVREWMTLVEAMSKGLVAADLKRFYAIARATLVKHERYYDQFDQCFAHFFAGADAPPALKSALEAWLQAPLPLPQLSEEELAALERLSPDELRKRFEETMRQQTERHDGGNRWIGTGGTSPFGHGGVNPAGVRVGGAGGGKSAIQIATQRRFRDYRSDIVLDTRQIGAALRKLRRLSREGQREEVDIDGTIAATAKNAGDIEVVLQPPRENNLKVLLLMDVGGSMEPYALLVSRLFSAAHAASHFREFHHFYFHNCIYEAVYRDARMSDAMSTVELTRWLQPETRLIVVGDAHMAPYELTAPFGAIDYYVQNRECGLDWMRRVARHFKHRVWLNPLAGRFWAHPTIHALGELFPMYELTLDGLEEAVERLLGLPTPVRERAA